MGIAFTAPAAPGHHQTVTGVKQLPQQISGIRIKDQGARRNRDDEGGTAFALTVLFSAGLTARGLKEAAPPEVGQSAGMFVGFQHHVPAGSAVAAVRTAPGLEAGPLEAYTTGTAVSAPDGDLRLIRKGSQAMG